MKNQPHRSNRVKRYVRSTNTKIRRIDKAYLNRLIAVPSQSILSSKHFVEKCMLEPGAASRPAFGRLSDHLMSDLVYLRDVHYNHRVGTAPDPVQTQRLLDDLKAKLTMTQMKPEYLHPKFDPVNNPAPKYYHATTGKKS